MTVVPNASPPKDILTGVVVSAYSGWYDVAVGDEVYEARPRGRLRRHQDEILTGDRVEVCPHEDGSWTIEAVLPRRNQLVRPPVANVDQAIIVFTLELPPWNRSLTDRIAVMAEAAGLEVIFCLNKIDLVAAEAVEAAAASYRRAGYRVLTTDAKHGAGVAGLREHLRGKVSVLAGESGVGKSTLLNALEPGLGLETGEVSRKLRRGRHTTRRARLLPLHEGDGKVLGFVVDTPGFNRLDVTVIERHELAWLFPDFRPFRDACRFDDCLHRAEPGCAVKEAVARGQIEPARYDSYLDMLAEIEQHRANLYR
ncbi:MAG TPA: ribosome small subunit-dependent GTPase A [Bacillota bacterium]